MSNRSQRNKRNRLMKAFAEQEGECIYCDQLCWLPWAEDKGDPKRMATREHLKRKADGGPNVLENIAMACWECNHNRHAGGNDFTPVEWIAMRGGVLPGDCATFGSHTSKTYDFEPKRKGRK